MSKTYGIGAKIKCFTDRGCTDELDSINTAYVYRLGPITGFNGTNGDYIAQTIFLKNVGDTDATDIYIIETGDTDKDMFRMKVEGQQLIASTKLPVGTLEPGKSVGITIYSSIPAKADPVDSGIIDYTIKYNTRLTQPGDVEYYIDTIDNDKVEYVRTTEYRPKDASKYKRNFQEFEIVNFKNTGDEVPMKVPVRIKYHKEATKGLDNEAIRTGRAFGYGPYGEPLYGQEGFMHITDSISAEIPILGEKVQSIAASFSILSKYNGKEDTIEDIQSYYTEKFMMLGCYDGPALPLWLND